MAKKVSKTRKSGDPLRVSVYFDAEDAEVVEKAAKKAGLPVTTWVRDAAAAVAHSGKAPARGKPRLV